MEILTKLILVSVLIEAVVDWVKDFVASRFAYQKISALIASLVIAAGLNLNFFSLIGLEGYRWPAVGIVLAALVLSRGSNYVQDFWDMIGAWRRGQ